MASIQVLEISPAEIPIEDLSYDVAGNITGGFLDQLAAEVIRAVFIECRITYPDNPEQAVDCTKEVLKALFFGI